jgi:hypothetical protein
MKSQIITAIGFAVVAAVLVTGLTSSVFGQGNMTGGNMTGGNMTAGTPGGNMSTANGENGNGDNGDNGDGGDNGEEDDGEGSN